ncbi:hypothetical protein ACI2L4_37200 [Streptomyces sparsogenes]|uniref:hypothetical protein n=1 Tax=Streptomyces sparsogenes TaxID=67365 RepID=UPI0033CAE3BF
MSRQREADRSAGRTADRIPGGTVRATVLSVLRYALPLLTVALWLTPAFLHPATEHISVVAPWRPAPEKATPAATPPTAAERAAEAAHAASLTGPRCPDPAPVRYVTGANDLGGAGDNCVAGPQGAAQALVPAPVAPPALTGLPPRDRPYDTDATRAPPDHAVRALGLHQLQVLRT